MKFQVDGRVLIDTAAWNRFCPNSAVSVSALKRDVAQDSEEYDIYYSDDDMDGAVGEVKKAPRVPLTEEQLVLCVPTVRGYAMKNKKWLTFYVDQVHEITWNEHAFDSLVMPQDQKDLILSFSTSQLKRNDTFDDIIAGKGKGIIMLLSGPPGVGKTLTAESVAETMHAPLYMMSAGDLGLDPGSVEQTLSTVLEMVTKWNAVLLLDECDVFLEERSPHDLERNKLVSIFLRMLEYYEGILFLTTNAVERMDPAFQSRIHVSLEYPELDRASRAIVWKNFLKMSEQNVGEAEVEKLARISLNGRQIKNVLKTSQLLASHKEMPLAFEYIKTVLQIERKGLDL